MFRLYGAIGLGLALLAAFATLTISRNYWKDTAGDWKEESLSWRKSTGEVTASIANSIGNPDLKWKNVPSQVRMYSQGHDLLVSEVNFANARLAEMGSEAKRMKQLSAKSYAAAKKATAQRDNLIGRLQASSNDPGDRDNLQEQIAAVEATVDAIFEGDI